MRTRKIIGTAGIVLLAIVALTSPARSSGARERKKLERPTELSGQLLPAGTWVDFDEQGRLACCFLPGPTEIQGHVCRGHGHDYQTCFHPDGSLRFCNLVEVESIDGIPCQRSTFLIWIFVGNAGVTFHDNGRLKGCLLAADVEREGKRLRRGRRIELDPDGHVVSPAP